MAPSSELKTKNLFKEIGLRLFVLALLSLGVALCAGFLFNDPNVPPEMGLISFVFLTLWWLFLAWRQKAQWILDLQAFLLEKQMLSYPYEAVKGVSPWDLVFRQEAIL